MKELLKEFLKCRETSEIPKKLLNALLDTDSREHILQLINKKKMIKLLTYSEICFKKNSQIEKN